MSNAPPGLSGPRYLNFQGNWFYITEARLDADSRGDVRLTLEGMLDRDTTRWNAAERDALLLADALPQRSNNIADEPLLKYEEISADVAEYIIDQLRNKKPVLSKNVISTIEWLMEELDKCS